MEKSTTRDYQQKTFLVACAAILHIFNLSLRENKNGEADSREVEVNVKYLNFMGQMINKDGDLIRISPKDSGKLEYSTNDGRTWMARFAGSSSVGDFEDLTDNGKEILAQTSNGLFYSVNDGRSWMCRKRN